MSKKNKGYCYYCCAQATTLEHVPPKQMFKGFQCDRITVPSCDLHNTEKGGQDQAIVNAFLIALSNIQDIDSLTLDVKIAIARAKPELVKRSVISAPLVKHVASDIPEVAYIFDNAQIFSWLQLLTAALIYDGTKIPCSDINWDGLMLWSPNWIPSETDTPIDLNQIFTVFEDNHLANKDLEKLPWIDGWSSGPRPYPNSIYSFKFYVNGNKVIFWHRFYNNYSWFVSLEMPTLKVERIIQRSKAPLK